MPNDSYLIAFLNRKKVVLMAERYAWLISDFSEESRMSAEIPFLFFNPTGLHLQKKTVFSSLVDQRK